MLPLNEAMISVKTLAVRFDRRFVHRAFMALRLPINVPARLR